MTPIGRSIASWLSTGVGVIVGKTPAEAVANAYERFPGKKSFTLEHFREHLAIVGYEPVQRSNGWVIHLPEHIGRKV